VLQRTAQQKSARGPHSLHTAEVTGSIPVTPTSEDSSQAHSLGPFARRFAENRGLGWVPTRSAWLARAAGESTNSWAVVLSTRSAASLPEHPVTPAELSWGDRFRELEGERQSPVERMDDSVGHLRGGVPVAGADPAANPPAPHGDCAGDPWLVDDPRRNAFVLKPGRKAMVKIVASTKLQMC
jgi:hypothetical protein